MDGGGGGPVKKVFRVLFAFCGVGGGALGFQRAKAEYRSLGVEASFEVVGGIELDASTARDFSRLTGAPCLVADLGACTGAFLRDLFGDDIDVIVFSPPCKPASGLLAAALAATEKYRAMAMLGAVFVRTMFDAWPRGPKLLVMENVPRIRSRAPEMMEEIRATCRARGFLIHECAHDLGELGGLAQHRSRLLFVGRRRDVPTLLYQPPKKRVRSIGEVLGALPMPGDPKAGRLHALPAIEAITAIRLALIPAGGDWRDLPERVYLPPELAAAVGRRKKGAKSEKGSKKRTPFNDVYRVVRFEDPAPCVTGGATPSAGGISVADPRLLDPREGRDSNETRNDDHGVIAWDEASGTITGQTRPSSGRFSVADPRTVKPSHPHTYGVVPWSEASHTITGNTHTPGGGPFSVADPRLTCEPRETSGAYGVVPWSEASGTVVAHACHDNGRFSAADPRAMAARAKFPVIVAEDGTWHRPLTALECAVLQGFEAFDGDGLPLELTGSTDDVRVKIGDAMPVTATEAIARQMLHTLTYASVGGFALSEGGDVWVRERARALTAATVCEGRA